MSKLINPGSGLPPVFRRCVERAFKLAKAVGLTETKNRITVTFYKTAKLPAPRKKR